jgi:hypothetical protein
VNTRRVVALDRLIDRLSTAFEQVAERWPFEHPAAREAGRPPLAVVPKQVGSIRAALEAER